MPREVNGKIYLTQKESTTRLGVSLSTFKGIEEDYCLRADALPGRTRFRYFRQEAIELIGNSTLAQREEIKEKIRKIQLDTEKKAEQLQAINEIAQLSQDLGMYE